MENNIDACRHCAYCYECTGRPELALQSLPRSFAYDRPRAEVCCELGRWFFQREQKSLAAYWYSLALTCTRDDGRGGFVSPGCYDYLPYIQLCVCYSRLGDLKRAEQMNELAAASLFFRLTIGFGTSFVGSGGGMMMLMLLAAIVYPMLWLCRW